MMTCSINLRHGFAGLLAVALLASGGAEPVGFKIGATSEKAQSFIGTQTPFFGEVLREGCQESPA